VLSEEVDTRSTLDKVWRGKWIQVGLSVSQGRYSLTNSAFCAHGRVNCSRNSGVCTTEGYQDVIRSFLFHKIENTTRQDSNPRHEVLLSCYSLNQRSGLYLKVIHSLLSSPRCILKPTQLPRPLRVSNGSLTDLLHHTLLTSEHQIKPTAINVQFISYWIHKWAI
jgi:hypothetical protein